MESGEIRDSFGFSRESCQPYGSTKFRRGGVPPDHVEVGADMTVSALKRSIAVAVFLLCLLASAPLRAQLACNSPAQGFSTGIPAGWSVVDNAGQGVVWGNLAACGEAGNYTGGAGDAACVSSDHAGQREFDTELRSPVFSLAGATSASL